jgi:hypothetical protein
LASSKLYGEIEWRDRVVPFIDLAGEESLETEMSAMSSGAGNVENGCFFE